MSVSIINDCFEIDKDKDELIRKDTYSKTPYTAELSQLQLDGNNVYSLGADDSST